MNYKLHIKWMVVVCMLSASLISETARSQSTHIISPREYSTALPSAYPSGVYIMDSENDAPYSWGHDASMILGLKRSQSNYRHVQMLIWRDGSNIAIRGKDGQNDSWLPWKHIRDETWIEDNFVQKYENGKVGIGTTNPESKLHIQGYIQAGDNIHRQYFPVSVPHQNAKDQIWLLTKWGQGNNEVIGTFYGQRSSGLYGARSIDIIYSSAGTTSNYRAFLESALADHYNEKWSLVTVTYNSEEYLALRLQADGQYLFSKFYFKGYVASNDHDERFTNLLTSEVSGITEITYNSRKIFAADKVGIGTNTPDEKLTVAGTVKSREVIVEENTGADFVFEEEYELPSLSELEAYIKAHRHLPEISTAEQMKAEGVKVGELQMKLLQKIEELTLYVIEQNKTINQLKSENKEIKQQLKQGVQNECEK